MLPGWCCIAIAALELGNGDSWCHMCAFRFHFWGRKVNWNQASHVRASSVIPRWVCRVFHQCFSFGGRSRTIEIPVHFCGPQLEGGCVYAIIRYLLFPSNMQLNLLNDLTKAKRCWTEKNLGLGAGWKRLGFHKYISPILLLPKW